MASNPPPFQVEDDSIDDDFFDNLVVSDDDDTVPKTYVTTDGNDSDDANLFANLTINDDEVVVNNVVVNNVVDIANVEERKEAIELSNSENVVGNQLVGESSLSDANLGSSNGVGVKEVDWSVFHADSESEQAGGGNGFGSYADVFGEVDNVKDGDPFENLVGDSSSNGALVAGVEGVHVSAVVEKSIADVFGEVDSVKDGDPFGNLVGDSSSNGTLVAGVESVHASAVVEKSIDYVQNDNVVADYNGNGEDLMSSQYWESQYPFENLVGDSSSNGTSVAGVESVHVSAVVEKSTDYLQSENVAADVTGSQYWESQYPGWKYDSGTGQWYQVENLDTGASELLNTDTTKSSNLGISEGMTDVSSLQQNVQSVAGSVAETSAVQDLVVDSSSNGTLVAGVESVHVSAVVEKSTDYLQSENVAADVTSSQYWESQYPGWKYDSSTGQWYQVESLDTGASELLNTDTTKSSNLGISEGLTDFSSLQQNVQSVAGSVAETSTVQDLGVDSSSNGTLVAGIESVHVSAVVEKSTDYMQSDNVAADVTSSQYWESQYPGWKYDSSTGQWYQVESLDTGASELLNTDTTKSSNLGISEGMTDVSSLQQNVQYVAGSVAETSMVQDVTSWDQVIDSTEMVKDWSQVSQVGVDTIGAQTDWNQVAQDNNGYPRNMVFDPQYPGWYYNTVVQEWCTLESYNESAVQSTAQIQDQAHNTEYASTNDQNNDQKNNNHTTHNGNGQDSSFMSQDFGKQAQELNWSGSGHFQNHQASIWKPDAVAMSESTLGYNVSHLTDSHDGQNFSVTAGSEQNSYHHGGNGSYYETVNQVHNNFFMPSQSQGFVVGDNSSQHINGSRINQNEQKHTSFGNYSHQNSFAFSQPEFQNAPISYAHASGRSSAGRPAHAMVSFGFGGKLIVMKHNSQKTVGNSPAILNLAEVVNGNTDASNQGVGTCNYFQALGSQSVPGPLTGGSVGAKELNKWIDERITNPGSLDVDYEKAEVLKLLLSLLKIACQYYGKLRSPYSTDAAVKETDAPESAVAKLFALAKDNLTQFSQYGAQCLQQMPSEEQMQVAAAEVQSLLVSGRKKEALQCAQDGQLWGPALVLAAQLGDQFYVETIKQMSLRQLVAGSPMRTLCLLIAGQPADVFPVDSTSSSSMPGYASMPQQPAQIGASGMLDDWEENLAVITANRTKNDELVLIHLGDCLWKERSNIIAAHICYLVAEASFEPYSDSARLCLVGADHWKSPRTYASPEAIQRTEMYEYSKTLGNSQFVLLPFQPYKLMYAHMLAEVGRISDALKYAQAVLKSLKTGRSPEVEILKHLASSLEERIKTYQQGGFSTNLAPSKLVGKLLNLFDNTASRVVGGLPPHVPTAAGNMQGAENHYQHTGSRVSSSQSTLAMSSFVPSQTTEPLNEWVTDQAANYTRSVSEPNFRGNPRQGQTDSGKEASSVESKASTSRLGRFGFGSQILQKTVGLVLKPRQGKQAKLGDTNKFYYDEKLKRWVEEGAEPPAEETAPPPPPTTAVFQNGTPDYNLKGAMQNEASHLSGTPEFKSSSPLDNHSGIPPLPMTTNQYSARGRMGVRSRYVDTFNKGGGNSTNLFQSPAASNIKPTSAAKPTFFMPTAPISTLEQQPIDSTPSYSMQEDNFSNTYENSTPSPVSNSSQSHTPPSSSMTMLRFPSMNNISNKEMTMNGSFSVNSRRTASWSGFNNSFSPPHAGEVKPLGEVLGIEPSSVMPIDAPLAHSWTNSGSFGDDLQQVDL